MILLRKQVKLKDLNMILKVRKNKNWDKNIKYSKWRPSSWRPKGELIDMVFSSDCSKLCDNALSKRSSIYCLVYLYQLKFKKWKFTNTNIEKQKNVFEYHNF